jgi:cell division protein FtsQ
MKKTILFWLMFVFAVILAIYFAVRIITVSMSPQADLNALAAQIAARPDLRFAAVRRLPNGKIATRAQRHKTIAHWTDGTNYYPLTADGVIVNSPNPDRPDASVVFRGRVPDDISEITDIARDFAAQTLHLEWIEDRRWNMTTTTGAVVMLPEGDMESAFETLAELNESHTILGKNIKTLDMRDSARILVK